MNPFYHLLVSSCVGMSLGATIVARTECKTLQVKSGDSCGSLASQCAISAADFATFNPSSTLCSTLTPGRYVCCSAGSLPDLTPKPDKDGTCATHFVASGQSCSAIAAMHGVEVKLIEELNKQTWGWLGCDALSANSVVCISKGTAPMPSSLPGAMCGPQVNGTTRPQDMSTLASLNPCPLNACCNIWGQCGITDDFCKPTNSSTRAPGTAAKGTNGCISNCGTDVRKPKQRPENFKRIGYFEAWNAERPCLTMSPWDIRANQYTDIHYAFASIDHGTWTVNVSQYDDFFWQFKTHTLGRVLSIGGWTFSTDQTTYSIFREAVSEKNFEAFADNVVAFLNLHDLTGLDFDWEYPGESDIPGIPASSEVDTNGYLRFLRAVRARLPKGKTLSVAVPASYWYLKNFRLADIALVVDYMVFMTYDLHGQWDYGNKWAADGCPDGSCLRSHVNLTETMNALAMITKADVPASKVVVGVTNYGRSFQMTTAGCSGPTCSFTGPQSGAMPGRCTNMAGFLAEAEIYEISRTNHNSRMWYDKVSNTDIMTWNDTQWVSFMSNDTKKSRTDYYEQLGFAGVVEWAIDLESFEQGNANNTQIEIPACQPPCGTPVEGKCVRTYTAFDDLNKAMDQTPPHCVEQYQLQILDHILSSALDRYNAVLNDGYDDKFGWYVRSLRDTLPESFRQWMKDNSEKYFTCTVEGRADTCPTIPDPSAGGAGSKSATFKFKNETAFYLAVEDKLGIPKDWMMIANPHSESYGYNGQQYRYSMTGVPLVKGDFEVPNPKDVIANALMNLTAISGLLSAAASDVEQGVFISPSDDADGDETYSSDEADAILAASLPVFMAQNAISAMARVQDVGEKAKEDFTKKVIVDFVMAALSIIPAVGEYMSGAEVAMVASMGRLLTYAADAGDLAFSGYSLSEDPHNPVFAVFAAIGAARGFKDAATIVRTIKADVIKGLGKDVEDSLGALQKGYKGCT